jgi:outer membrane protein OmpA-like peptidoglycan-associated protein
VRYNEQIKLKNIDVFSEIYVVAINYNAAIDNEMVTFDRNNGHIEITTDMDDNIDIPIDNPKAGQVYLICKIENIDACKKVVNIGNVLTLNQAFHQIPGFGLICDSDAKLKKKTLSDSQRFKWWWWWLLLIAIVVGLFFIMKKCSSGDCDIPAVKYPVKPADKTIVKEKAPAETKEKYSPAEKSDSIVASLPYKKGEAYTIYQFQSGESNCYRTNTELDKLIKTMSENKDMKIHIFAYTDKSGSVETNHALSQKRAKAIYDYIVSKGIDKSRLSYEGKDISTRYGNDAENRRAEFILK